jgi:hypothetical protein
LFTILNAVLTWPLNNGHTMPDRRMFFHLCIDAPRRQQLVLKFQLQVNRFYIK